MRRRRGTDKMTLVFIILIILIIAFIGILVLALGYIGYTSLVKERPKPPDTSIIYRNESISPIIIQHTSSDQSSQEQQEQDNQQNETNASQEEQEVTYNDCSFPDKPHGSKICASLDATHTEEKYIWECQNGTWVHVETCSSAANCIESGDTAECLT
ncbi:MAG: hypothetical protein J7K68_05715 [Candidatus Diapherotrites archaeon]|nr:hypothetical protein [Candidatus Diapherotrites archaeon]